MIEYRSNNSGGSWWLDDEDWKALEADGWQVEWIANDPSRFMAREGRFLGALATSATLVGASMAEALESFQRVTGLDPDDSGCDCCGPPHSFYESPDVIPGQLAALEVEAA